MPNATSYSPLKARLKVRSLKNQKRNKGRNNGNNVWYLTLDFDG